MTDIDPPECVLDSHRARWLADGDATFASILELIAQARQSVCLESYIVRPGEPAASLLAGLIAACARGVQVRVLYDAFGSEGLPRGFFAPLEAAGAQVRAFSPARRLRLAFRNHRKLLLVDAQAAIIGGYNIGPEYTGDGVTRGWRDLALKISGPIAATLAESFEAMFALAPVNASAFREFRRAARRLIPLAGPVTLLTSGPGWPAGFLTQSLRHDLGRARSVRCMAGYFLPSGRIRRALHWCSARGGKVQLLLAGKTDVPVARYAGEHLYARMLSGGAELYEYQPQVLHAKLILMDEIVYVGSCNLDRRSLNINYELLLRLQWPELAEQGRRLFADALTYSRAVQAGDWMLRRGWWARLRSSAAYWLLTRIDPYVARRRLRSIR